MSLPKINCRIVSSSDCDHLRQLYAGFLMLHKNGTVNASQTIEKKPLGKYQEVHLKVILNEQITVYYDMHDCGEILPEYLAGVDFYFKRSYSKEIVNGLAEREKIYPYGFNYPVNAGEFDLSLLHRRKLHHGGQYLRTVLEAVGALTLLGKPASTLRMFEAAPDYEREPRIIFMARVWNPERIENKSQAEAVKIINQSRAESVRVLRKEFGKKFFGGLAVDDYSRANFKDVLLPNEAISSQREYLRVLKNYPICVTTRGLCNSNGWKLAEYIALSKAIVSETLRFETTGNFAKEKNYLEFASPEELVSRTVELFEDKEKREEMMRANHDYYLNYLRPDKLIFNTLQITQTTPTG